MQTQNQVEPTNRLYFLDNLRYLMVFLVIPLHSLMSYWKEAASSQPVSDAQFGPVSPVVFLILESFPMEILFFIAGYFAVTSLQKEGYASFVMRKLKRLGIPLVLVIVFQIPIILYIQAYTHSINVSAPSLWDIWMLHLQKVFTPHFGIIDFSKHFFPTVFWFLMALLFFFLLFAVLYWIIIKIKGTDFKSQSIHDHKPIFLVMMLFGCIGGMGFFIMDFFFSDWDHWLSIGNVVVFRPTRIFIYIAFFSMGVYACVKQWFHSSHLPGRIWMYAVSSIILLISLLVVVIHIIVSKPSSLIIQFAQGFLRSFYCISVLGLLLSITHTYCNKFSNINQKLAENSYNIYLIHYIIVVLFQLLMLGFPGIPAYVKFIIVSIFSGVTTYAVSNYFLRPYPKIFVGAMIVLFFILVIILR